MCFAHTRLKAPYLTEMLIRNAHVPYNILRQRHSGCSHFLDKCSLLNFKLWDLRERIISVCHCYATRSVDTGKKGEMSEAPPHTHTHFLALRKNKLFTYFSLLSCFSQMTLYCPPVAKLILQEITYCEAGESNIATCSCHLPFYELRLPK